MDTDVTDHTDFELCNRGADSLARAFDFLGKKWNAQLIGSLSGGPVGFSELSRGVIGISDSVLSERLTGLAEAGLINRQVDEGPPVAVTYELTERGEALIPALQQIAIWSASHLKP